MRIDGAGVADHLKITFTHLSEPDVESWFVVSMVKRDYEGKLPAPVRLSPSRC